MRSLPKLAAAVALTIAAACGAPTKKPAPTAPTPSPEVPTPPATPTKPGPISPVPTAIATPAVAVVKGPGPAKPGTPAGAATRARTPIADAYRETAAKILAAGVAGNGAWTKLAYLTDKIGHRVAGSKGLEQAVAWAQKVMIAEGHENVRGEKVMVTHWERGELSLEIVGGGPAQKLHATALGLSPGTSKKGVTAPVVIVKSFDELTALGEKGVKGKIVLFNHAMPAYHEDHGSGYGGASAFRTRGPAAASKLGAVAALTRSATARSLRSPHTGVTIFDPTKGDRPIPAAAVATEDADLIARLSADGPVTVKLVLGARDRGKVPSANVIGELRGREKPEEIVLIGAHIDSWDLGQGAHDDGAGVVIMMEALSILRRGGWQPRRTVRVVLFTNEEHGIDGAQAYAREHAKELPLHVAAIESDGGSFKPVGLSIETKSDTPAYARLQDLVTLLEPIGATSLEAGHSGADLIPLVAAGVPCLGHRVDGSTYFDYHHTEADTLDKVDPIYLQQNAAMMAVVAYVLADMPERLAP